MLNRPSVSFQGGASGFIFSGLILINRMTNPAKPVDFCPWRQNLLLIIRPTRRVEHGNLFSSPQPHPLFINIGRV
jgi:hypothetical protein